MSTSWGASEADVDDEGGRVTSADWHAQCSGGRDTSANDASAVDAAVFSQGGVLRHV